MGDYFKHIREYMEGVNEMAEKDGVDFWDWICFLEWDCYTFYKLYNDLITVQRHKNSNLPESEYILKNIMQNNYVFGPDHYTQEIKTQLDICQKRVFGFLDSVDEPYKYLFTPLWFFNTYVYKKGYYPYKHEYSGVSNGIAKFIAHRYAMYVIDRSISQAPAV